VLLDLKSLQKEYHLDIKGVLHIGAHHGEENSVYDDLAIQNRIFFEPLSDNFKKLHENIGSRFPLIKKALGVSSCEIEMYVEKANGGQSSSILKPSLHLVQYPHITFPEKEMVEMVRLDDVDFERNEFNFINIDVQGYELEVFKGGIQTLENIDYIMTELNIEELYENCSRLHQVEEFLGRFGFKLVKTNWAGFTWGDGFFIKEKLL
jgi:FkbM family methyltransferase